MHSKPGKPWPISGSRISYQHLQFQQVPITMQSFRGTKYIRWMDIGMPEISNALLNCVFYLYRNREEAEIGSEYGGTGFFVGVPSKKDTNYDYHYAVTNYHVVKDGFTTIRVKMRNGEYDFLEYIFDIDWKYIPGGGDVAVAALGETLHGDKYDAEVIPISLFAIERIVQEKQICVGDDVFMVGRFIDYDGGPTNLPAVRFGNISVMPTNILTMKNGVKKSYCIDLHSRSGFSGSPVFVYGAPGRYLDMAFRSRNKIIGGSLLYLLGIHWGQFPEYWKITEKENLEETPELTIEGNYVKGVSGMTSVMIPEPILDALNMPQFEEQRRKGDIELEKDFRKHGYPPEPETAKEPIANTDNPQHKEDFNSLLTAAVKKKPPADET